MLIPRSINFGHQLYNTFNKSVDITSPLSVTHNVSITNGGAISETGFDDSFAISALAAAVDTLCCAAVNIPNGNSLMASLGVMFVKSCLIFGSNKLCFSFLNSLISVSILLKFVCNFSVLMAHMSFQEFTSYCFMPR